MIYHPLYLSRVKRRNSRQSFRQAWDRLRHRANINDLTFHDLRHEAISRMFDSGMKIHEVMAVSGHKTAGQLFRYVQAANSH
ncbi:tyrosine-type recombinase/integrase [Alphaproteobacteria bacterium]|nr:tyrosine-type recombinase/integrase [Alphaproteobacteria bacterium]